MTKTLIQECFIQVIYFKCERKIKHQNKVNSKFRGLYYINGNILFLSDLSLITTQNAPQNTQYAQAPQPQQVHQVRGVPMEQMMILHQYKILMRVVFLLRRVKALLFQPQGGQ
jgi:hypothetical protein